MIDRVSVLLTMLVSHDGNDTVFCMINHVPVVIPCPRARVFPQQRAIMDGGLVIMGRSAIVPMDAPMYHNLLKWAGRTSLVM